MAALGQREPALLAAALSWLPACQRAHAAAVCRLWRSCVLDSGCEVLCGSADLEPFLEPAARRRLLLTYAPSPPLAPAQPPALPCDGCDRPASPAGRGERWRAAAAAVKGAAGLCGRLRVVDLSGVDFTTPTKLQPDTRPHAAEMNATGDSLLATVLERSHGTLEELVLRLFPMTSEGSSDCFRRYPPRRLRRLVLRGCRSAALGTILEECPRIESLDVRGVREDVILRSMSGGLPARLRRLTVGWFSEFDGSRGGFAQHYASEEVSRVLAEAASGRAAGLTHLEIPGFASVRPWAIAPFAAAHSLVSLDLGSCMYLNDQVTAPLVRANPQLQSVNLRGTGITDATLCAIGDACPELAALNVSCTHARDAGLLAVTKGCRKLQLLDVCYLSCPASPVVLVEVCSLYGENLRMLGIGGHKVSDAHLAQIVRDCPNLDHLGIGGCVGLTVEAWTILGSLPRLRKLLAHGLPDVTFEAVLRTLRSCTQLRFLDLFNVPSGPLLTQEQLDWLELRYPYNWLEDWEV